jgi:hypothetical protein
MQILERILFATGVVVTLASVGLPCTASAGGTVDTTFNAANFTPGAPIDNKYWPLIPGTQFVFTDKSADGCEVELFQVTNNVKYDFPPPYDSIAATEILDRSWLSPQCDGRYSLAETAQDWHAQDNDGNVWYFGENTVAYDADQCPSSEGSWTSGVNGAEPGIIMLAHPQPGDTYRQEFDAGNAEDWGKVLRLNDTVDIGFGAFNNCLVTKEWSPLEKGAVEQKFYCPAGGGLMLNYELKGKTLRIEYVGNSLPEGQYAQAGVCPPK